MKELFRLLSAFNCREIALRSVSVLFSISVASCASSPPKATMTSVIDPFWDGVPFSRLLVRADPTNLGLCKSIEGMTVEALGKQGVKGASASIVLPPVREYTVQEWQHILMRDTIDAYLLILPKWTVTQQVTLPLVSASSTAPSGAGGASTVQVSYGGGDRNVVSHRAYEVSLVSATSGNRVWVAELIVGSLAEDGSAFTQFSAARLVKQLSRDHLVRAQ